MQHLVVLVSLLAFTSCDVSHLNLKERTTTEPPPPKPYVFSYTAGRFPGHVDRQHTEVSDGSGVVRGRFSYVDPRHKVRTVDYVADKQGFHPVLSEQPPDHPAQTQSVARETDRHLQLYDKIAEEHAHPGTFSYVDPHQKVRTVDYVADKQDFHSVQSKQPPDHPAQTQSVARETDRHLQLYDKIAEEHAHPGTFSYVDPHQRVRTVDYVADRQGIHSVQSKQPPDHPAQTQSVARETDRHLQLYDKIAEEHAHPGTFTYVDPHQRVRTVDYVADRQGIHSVQSKQPPDHPAQTQSVARETDRHLQLYDKIAEEHAHPGTFSYVDPHQRVRNVDYVADRQGFHSVQSNQPPDHPAQTQSVARATDRHLQLYAKIAEKHAHPESSIPRQSKAVAFETAIHANLFRVIAEQHARIAAEREILQKEEEEIGILRKDEGERQHLQN